jgi:N-glycosylase/DNA lyase
VTAPQYSAATLRRTVAMVCGLIDERKQSPGGTTLSETELRFELVSCLLGSQVRAESANVAADRLCSSGLLSDERWAAIDTTFEGEVRDVLAGRVDGLDATSYRFPVLRARQLAELRSRLIGRPLISYLDLSDDVGAIRRHLVRDLPGIGPKQASMFLRNVGASHDLAVLDVHVLRFLHHIEVLPDAIPISAIDPYERVEAKVRGYAKSVGRPVGHLDWAIWITMRAAREVRA